MKVKYVGQHDVFKKGARVVCFKHGNVALNDGIAEVAGKLADELLASGDYAEVGAPAPAPAPAPKPEPEPQPELELEPEPENEDNDEPEQDEPAQEEAKPKKRRTTRKRS